MESENCTEKQYAFKRFLRQARTSSRYGIGKDWPHTFSIFSTSMEGLCIVSNTNKLAPLKPCCFHVNSQGAMLNWCFAIYNKFHTMIPKQSPEGQLLTVSWRTMLGMAGPVSEQYRWMLTGLAAMLGLMVANLDSIQKVVQQTHLKWCLSFLVVSVLLASIAYLLSAALKARNDVMYQLEQILGSVEAQAVLSQMTTEQSELRRQLCKPFFGPMKLLMVRAAEKGANDPFAMEKGGITLMVWQAYAMWLGIILATIGLILLVIGLN